MEGECRGGKVRSYHPPPLLWTVSNLLSGSVAGHENVMGPHKKATWSPRGSDL